MKRKSLSIIMGMVFLFSVSSCDLFDLDINTDPNNPSAVSPALLLNNVEVDGIASVVGSFNSTGMGFVAQTDASDNFFFNNQSWNGTWNGFYTGPLKDLEELIKATDVDVNADGKPDQPRYLGVAQVLKAYMFSVMVDWWGDIPYSEAFKGDATPQIKTPVYDDDAVIYADCLALLDKAIANLALASPSISGDVIYGGSAAKWTKAAKSLKLKLLIQTRLVGSNTAAIQAMINDPGLITSADDDFVFQFSPSISPDYRHPNYAMASASYGGGYQSHQWMYELLKNQDPRLPFYVKRQTSKVLDPADATQRQTIPCSQRSDCVYNYFPLSNFVTQGIYGSSPADLATLDIKTSAFGTVSTDSAVVSKWYVRAGEVVRAGKPVADVVFNNSTFTIITPQLGIVNQTKAVGKYVKRGAALGTVASREYLAGFFGRDRSDPSGIPDDVAVRAAHGLYPYGGLYDDVPEVANLNKGKGDGIFPIATSWMVKFWQIEAILALSLTVDGETAASLFTKAMNEQFAKVNSFASKDASSIPMTSSEITDYVTKWTAALNAAGSNPAKLAVVLKQAWFCNTGNGLELYNTFRRTGLPGDLQVPLQLPGNFALSIPYAQDELNLNPNTPSKTYDNPATGPVFWDVLKYQFVK